MLSLNLAIFYADEAEEEIKDMCKGYSTYLIVGDNIDKSINPRYMTVDRQRQSLHFFHLFAALDRVDCSGLPSKEHIGDVPALGASVFLPTAADSKQLCSNFAVLIGRLIVKKVPYFSIFKKCIISHIPHRYSKEMSKKSTVVSNCCYMILHTFKVSLHTYFRSL